MTPPARLTDWTSLPEQDRGAALAQSRHRLATIGRALRAVVEDYPARQPSSGLLNGLPYVVKDMIATGAGAPNWGCAEPIDASPGISPLVEQLDAAGACLIGSADMTELAYEPSGMNAARGSVFNPWNFDAIPGGSSSGSAALVASGCCFVALGSDTGGSVRIPAHCCGITALKPTYGRLSVAGTMPLAPSLDTIGIMARSAADIAQVDHALADVPRPDLNASRLTLLEDAFAASDGEIAELCRGAVSVLSQQGLSVASEGGFPEDADMHVLTLMQAEAAQTHRERIDDPRIDAMLRRRLQKGLSITPAEQCIAMDARDRLRTEFVDRYLGDASVAVLPVIPLPTPLVNQVDPASRHFSAKTLYSLSRFTRFVNYFGCPVVAFPVGFDRRGLPVALQLVGRAGTDRVLLQIAQRFQAVTDWHGRVPDAIAKMIAADGVAA
jgi:aspartyl-tRNA(Asn)/glutamyl-tRNA(Gln) amidotransferase subunit A